MLEIKPARSGKATAIINGIQLHSPYDPVREADRFVLEKLKSEHPATILLIGAGLGYIIQAIKKAFPLTRIVPVFYSREIFEYCMNEMDKMDENELPVYWYPGKQPLLKFLRENIHELDTEGLKILEWPSSYRIFPDYSNQAHQDSSQLLKELRGSLVTTMSLGKRWIRNSFLNFLNISSTLEKNPVRGDRFILIAASGPSLKKSIPLIKRCRNHIYLWALPSSVFFLMEMGLVPDLVVITDPGYYAIQHLYSAISTPIDIAMPLSAAPGSWRIPGRIFLFSQENFFENILLTKAGISSPPVLPHGTVSASALDLALFMSNREIIYAGLDLCYEDIHAHVQPNTFKHYLTCSSSRLNPGKNILYTRAYELAPDIKTLNGKKIRSNAALETYAGWFAGLEPEIKKRVYRLNPVRPLPGFRDIDNIDFIDYIDKHFIGIKNEKDLFIPRNGYPSEERRKKIGKNLLFEWTDMVANSLDILARKKTLKFLISDPLLISLSYYIDSAALIETKRILRQEGEKPALEKAKLLLENEIMFFKSLSSKLGFNRMR